MQLFYVCGNFLADLCVGAGILLNETFAYAILFIYIWLRMARLYLFEMSVHHSVLLRD